jgi:hypothetical protein
VSASDHEKLSKKFCPEMKQERVEAETRTKRMSWKTAMDSSFPVVSIIPGGEGSAHAGQQVRMLTASYIDGFLGGLH